LPHKNLALELLRRLINDEIRVRSRRNLVDEGRSFAQMLDQTINRYHNRSIDSVQVIEDLIKLAKEIKEFAKRGEELGLSLEVLAFYDAIGRNEEVVEVLGDENLRAIAQELVRAGLEGLNLGPLQSPGGSERGYHTPQDCPKPWLSFRWRGRTLRISS